MARSSCLLSSESNYSLYTCPVRRHGVPELVDRNGFGAPPRSLTSKEELSMRIALLSYRSKTHCGGQGVSMIISRPRFLWNSVTTLKFSLDSRTRKLLDPRVRLTKVPSLDMQPRAWTCGEFRVRARSASSIDLLELLGVWTAGFPEPRTFTLRVAKLLAERAGDFDVVHDNQSLGTGLLTMADAGWPVVATVHHPITRDRVLDLAAARWWRKPSVCRRRGFSNRLGQEACHIPETSHGFVLYRPRIWSPISASRPINCMSCR